MARRLLAVLSDDQVERIAQATLEILATVGMDVASPRVRRILTEAGCPGQDRQIYFPEALVRGCLSTVPPAFSVRGLSVDRAVRIGDGRTHIQPVVGRFHLLNLDGTRRPTNLQDVARIVSLCDALPHFDLLHGGAVMPQITGVPIGLAHVAGFVETVRHTTKPFKVSCRGEQVARDCLRLADAVAAASRQELVLHTTCNSVSPLQMAAEMAEGALLYLERGWPVDFAAEPQLGATSPVTLAGTVAQGLAESLAGVVLAQVVHPGTPVFVGTVAAAMDMRHTTIALGGVEAALVNAAHAQMAAHFGVPARGTGATSNAKTLDFQAGYEKMLTALLPVLAGLDNLFMPGSLEHAETVSLESLVLDNDLCGIALRAQEGLRTGEDLLAVELIRQVGPGGNFLGVPQTAREMFTEHLIGGLWDRRLRSDWEAAGAPSRVEAAHEQVERLLAQPPEGLPTGVEAALREVATEIAEREGAPDLIAQLWP